MQSEDDTAPLQLDHGDDKPDTKAAQTMSSANVN